MCGLAGVSNNANMNRPSCNLSFGAENNSSLEYLAEIGGILAFDDL